jgi:ribonuclease D
MARRRDVAPGRILPDAAIVSAVSAAPTSPTELLELPVFGGRATRRHVDTWFGALTEAARLPEEELPLPVPGGDGPPPPNRWAERDPVAARRLARVRAAVTALAETHTMPAENLIQPDAVRRLAWQPPADATEDAVRAALTACGARNWQVTLVAGAIAAALPEPPPAAAPEATESGAAAPEPEPTESDDAAPAAGQAPPFSDA